MTRIADALEQVVLQQYGVYIGNTSKAAPDPNPKEPVSVRYATDEEMVKHNLIELIRSTRQEGEEMELESDKEEFGI